MRRLIWGFAGRTNHIAGNLMHWLKYESLHVILVFKSTFLTSMLTYQSVLESNNFARVFILYIWKFLQGFYIRETWHMQSFVKIKSSQNGKITLSLTDIGKSCISDEFLTSFNSICKNKNLAEIPESTVYICYLCMRVLEAQALCMNSDFFLLGGGGSCQLNVLTRFIYNIKSRGMFWCTLTLTYPSKTTLGQLSSRAKC